MPSRLLQGTTPALERGAYLTDGTRLWQVVDAADGQVALENCRYVQEPPRWMKAATVARDMRRVVPEE